MRSGGLLRKARFASFVFIAATLGWLLDGTQAVPDAQRTVAVSRISDDCLERAAACEDVLASRFASSPYPSPSAGPSAYSSPAETPWAPMLSSSGGRSGSSSGGGGTGTSTQKKSTTSPAPKSSPKPKPPSSSPGLVGATGDGGWKVACSYSHSLADDPIVAPGKSGGSHLHDFLGGKVTANSTYSSVSSGPTSCGLAADTAGYWVPALYRNGVKIAPDGEFNGEDADQRIYYRDDNLAPGTIMQPIPKNLRIVIGNAKATSEGSNPLLGSKVYYGCSDDQYEHQKKPPSCSSGIMTLKVRFPNCWDGYRLDSPDHFSHMAYPSDGKCPKSHPVPLPRITMRLEYPIGTSAGTITLASGPYYTAHGDFWNTWHQPKLEQLTKDCLNAGVDCGTLGK